MTELNSNLESEYRAYARECECALRIIEARIENIQQHFEDENNGASFQIITRPTKSKTFESVKEKCQRKGYDFTIESIKKNIHDIAGIRIVTTFRDDIFRIVERIKSIADVYFEEDEEKDYVSSPKNNGYRSYHLVVKVGVHNKNGNMLLPVEIQIRSKGMDMWASVEHIVKYKSDNKPTKETEEMFVEIATIIDQFDQKAIELRDSAKS